MKDIKVFPGFTPTFKAVCSAKENMEAGPGQVGKSMGMCQDSLSCVTKLKQESRPSALWLSDNAETYFL